MSPSPGTTVGESLGVRVSWAMAAETPLLPSAPDANVCRPSLRTASVIGELSHQFAEITDSENQIFRLYRLAHRRICYASKK
jgi:hypothetical protein